MTWNWSIISSIARAWPHFEIIWQISERAIPWCWFWGGGYYQLDCPFCRHRCQKCNKMTIRKASVENFLQAVQRNRARMLVNVDSRRCFNLKINNIPFKLQVDAGSDITKVSARKWRKPRNLRLDAVRSKVSSASGDLIFKMCYSTDHNINLVGFD